MWEWRQSEPAIKDSAQLWAISFWKPLTDRSKDFLVDHGCFAENPLIFMKRITSQNEVSCLAGGKSARVKMFKIIPKRRKKTSVANMARVCLIISISAFKCLTLVVHNQHRKAGIALNGSRTGKNLSNILKYQLYVYQSLSFFWFVQSVILKQKWSWPLKPWNTLKSLALFEHEALS